MANEELTQRGYLATGALVGKRFGAYEELDLGATRVDELVAVGIDALVPASIDFPFKEWSPPKDPNAAKPDRVFILREGSTLRPVAISEFKAPTKFGTDAARLSACEQSFFNASALGCNMAVATNGSISLYVDVETSAVMGEIHYFDEDRDFNPAVLANLLAGDAGVVKDPRPLAETVWQIIWHATKAEPRECLLTFVEMFVLKFLSDNLSRKQLPDAFRFYELTLDPKDFEQRHGMTAIEYYVGTIRPRIKTLFPDNVLAKDPALHDVFGLATIVSKTSVINGFAFLKSSDASPASFNRVFLDILATFDRFGPLTAIDPEFKLRLYETFLRRSARLHRLGQFFTPRNIVSPMIRMAELGKLRDGAVVLDPAAGVGGFVLDPLLFEDSLGGNYEFKNGKYQRRITTIGVEVDDALHILAKANMLLHLAEDVRRESTALPALNDAMADTFVLMNDNQTLGSLQHPPVRRVDVVLTNPPYVTEGSGIFRDELRDSKQTADGLTLADHYEGSGLGVEGLFLRYITGSLKPGGKAFVVVPMGLLNRTSPGPKRRVLEECNVLASIQLPRNAFFNTPQPAYILILHRRFSAADDRPNVFCAMARTIGETLDWERVPTPDDNDLSDIADHFVDWINGDQSAADSSPIVKIVSADEFTPDDRWDVHRFWTEDELVALGEKQAAVGRLDFIGQANAELGQVLEDFDSTREELENLSSQMPTTTFSLSDTERFTVRSGTRITNAQIRENPGKVPVYSCFTDARSIKGEISQKWLDDHEIAVEAKPIVTVMANGAKAVGRVFVRDPGCVITDDVIAIESLKPDIDRDYLAVALRDAIAVGGYVYEAKLFATRVRELSIDVPVTPSGDPDLAQQKAIAAAVRRFDGLRDQLAEIGAWSRDARVR